MAVEIHRVNTGLFSIDGLGNYVDKNDPNTTLSAVMSSSTEHRVIPNVTGPASSVNSADYPDINTYLQLEADDDFALAYIDQHEIVTQRIT